MPDEMQLAQVHVPVRVQTSSGRYQTVYMCELAEQDINKDGTINYPPTGTCVHDLTKHD